MKRSILGLWLTVFCYCLLTFAAYTAIQFGGPRAWAVLVHVWSYVESVHEWLRHYPVWWALTFSAVLASLIAGLTWFANR